MHLSLGAASALSHVLSPPSVVAALTSPVASLLPRQTSFPSRARALVLFSTQSGACYSGGTQALEEIKEQIVVSVHQSHVHLSRLWGMLPLQHLLPLQQKAEVKVVMSFFLNVIYY